MKSWISAIIIAAVLITLGYFVGQSCSGNESLTNIDRALKESRDRDKQIVKQIEAINDSLEVISQQRINNQTFNKYEIIKMDSLISIDSAWVNAIIRARIERCYQLPGFFQITSDTFGVGTDNKNPTGW
jgi:hypothetical protein